MFSKLTISPIVPHPPSRTRSTMLTQVVDPEGDVPEPGRFAWTSPSTETWVLVVSRSSPQVVIAVDSSS